MKKIILGIVVLVILISGYLIYQNNNQSTQFKVQVNAEYYQNLKNRCKTNEFKESCFDSVKTIEVVGGYKFGDFMIDGCEDNYELMILRSPGSYHLCVPKNNFDDDAEPVPMDVLTIKPGPGVDSDENSPVCTADAKSCGDGTFVGREGRNCEFSKCPGKKSNPDFVPTKGNSIELPSNVISEKDCTAQGGEVFNTLGETSYNGELIGKIEDLNCPCVCLIKSKKPDVLWINKNGNKEEFKGNLDDVKTFDDCKKAGFKILNTNTETCVVGEPHMTGGRYKTFANNPIETKKTCSDYTYSNCPGSCVAKCTPSSCGEPFEDGTAPCTSDCDGAGSCVVR